MQAAERDWIKYRDGSATQEIRLWKEHTTHVHKAAHLPSMRTLTFNDGFLSFVLMASIMIDVDV